MSRKQSHKQPGSQSAPAAPPADDARFVAACETHRRGDYSRAEEMYRAILDDDPEHGECLHLLGLLAFSTDRNAWAHELLARAVALEPDNTRWLMAYAHVLAARGRLDEAVAALTHALQREPANAGAWLDLGMYKQNAGQSAAAMEAYLRSLALDPRNASIHNHLGAVLRQEGDLDGAAEQFARAVALDPAYADAHSNWGVVCHARCDFAGAARKFAEALRLEPDHPDANGHMGSVLSHLGHPDAERYLRRALALKSGDPEARLNLALHLLRAGQFAEGWQLYEARWECPGFGRGAQVFEQPRWAGLLQQPLRPTEALDRPLRGKTIFVYAEQGLGDTFHFVRYLPLLLAEGARVVLAVHPLLLDLLRTWARSLQGDVQIIAEDAPPPHFDRHIPLLSLPLAFATMPGTIPPPVRLTPVPAVQHKHAGLRVGLCWAGNPKHALDRDRSLPLSLLAPLFTVPGVTFVSLQRGLAARQIEPSGLRLETLELTGFSTTAEVLDTLDLVISVDTAAAHLAATQGIPTWILLPFVIDWRWSLPAACGEPGSSAWYPSARLFRQPGLAPAGASPGSAWRPVIRKVLAALQHAAETPPPATLEG